ncbi:MAG: DUF6370 family protein [Candidatus Marinimicrobia bacterium]|jgi:hypothetical protein|nr:DUF6370 family protein [Candidatus Neomarinimicrobiota bacterium]|tara:strand:- start:91 stop:393 length:303 start_codon:yes stop_codon:yes gene_type:complete
MKLPLYIILPAIILFSCTKESKMQIVEASCGQCQFDMTEKGGCDLAVRIDGQTYFVDNSSLDDHGDAHGEYGLCNTIRKAKVTGEIVESRFKAESFELIK